MPTLFAKKITDISYDMLKKVGVRAILIDVDNTLSMHGSDEPFEGVYEWINYIKSLDIKPIIVSNNSNERVKLFAEKLNILYVSDAKKPLKSGFRKACNLLNLDKNHCAVIGDQLFTDILGANLIGMKSILIEPIDKNEPYLIRLKRLFEKPIYFIFKYKYKYYNYES